MREALGVVRATAALVVPQVLALLVAWVGVFGALWLCRQAGVQRGRCG